MSEGRLYDVARAHRAQLLANERSVASEMVRVYGGIWQRVQGELDGLLEEMRLAQLEGYEITEAWLVQQERYQVLLRQAEDELRRFAQYAEGKVLAAEADAVQAALSHAEQQVRTVLNRAGVSAAWVRLPTGAIEDLVGFTANGSPLADLLGGFGENAAKAIRTGLLEGLALGHNPEDIARQVREAFGGDLVRALRVSRTEVLRVYRESTRRAYQTNDEVVDGWIWNCACTPRSCAMCWAMHGTVHPLTERLNDHPNGRCSMLPLVKGVQGMAPQWQPVPGVDQFAKLEPNVQKNILGPLYPLYESGEISLADVVGEKFNRDWGQQRYVRSLASILKDKG